MDKKTPKFKHINKISELSLSYVENLNIQLDLLKVEYELKGQSDKKDLLQKISIDYTMNYEELENKYIILKNNKKTKKSVIQNEQLPVTPAVAVLDVVIINKTEYWYESKDNGKIYNTEGVVVGSFKDEQYILIK